MNEENTDLPSKLQPPKTSCKDKVLTVIKAAVAGVPLLGGSACELMELVLASPYSRRLQKWTEEVAQILTYLIDHKGIDINDLQNNEQFLSAIANASQIAMRNHESEKREALRNALINIAVGNTADVSLHNQFLNYIDIFTVLHIRLLNIFNVSRHSEKYTSCVAIEIEQAIPELRNKKEVYESFWNDLHVRRLVTIGADALHTMMTPQGARSKRTTDIGDQFIKFIINPDNMESNSQ